MFYNKLFVFFLLGHLFFSKSSYSTELKQGLSPFIKKLINKTRTSREHISYSLIDTQTFTNLEAFNDTKIFIPASLTKILTSYFALEVLGADYQFTTELSYDGKIENGKLKGNLYLTGSGDPLLSTAHLMNLAISLKTLGVKSIDGQFYFLNNKKKSLDKISDIGLGDQTYNPGLNDLSVNFNRFAIINTKRKKRITLPPLKHFKIQKSKKRLAVGQSFMHSNNTNSHEESWQFDSRKSYKRIEELPTRRPEIYTVKLFDFMCKKLAIDLPSGIPTNKIIEKDHTIIHTHHSPSVFKIASLSMEYSNNLLAEQLMLKAAQQYSEKESLSYNEAMEIMNKWLKKKSGKFWDENIILKNASGLTTKNKLTSRYLTTLISKIIYKQYSDNFFLTLFSLSGDSGWLRRRLIGRNSAYNVWAKTGSLDYINNISGMITTSKGKTLAFSILINDLKKRKKLDGKNSYKLERLRKKSKSFKRRNSKLANSLIEYWITKY